MPMIKINTPMKRMNCLKTADIPRVNTSIVEVNPTPSRLAKNSRNKVDVMLRVNVAMVMPVCIRLRIKSTIGKPTLLIAARQMSVFKV